MRFLSMAIAAAAVVAIYAIIWGGLFVCPTSDPFLIMKQAEEVHRVGLITQSRMMIVEVSTGADLAAILLKEKDRLVTAYTSESSNELIQIGTGSKLVVVDDAQKEVYAKATVLGCFRADLSELAPRSDWAANYLEAGISNVIACSIPSRPGVRDAIGYIALGYFGEPPPFTEVFDNVWRFRRAFSASFTQLFRA